MPTYRITGAMRETGEDVVVDLEAVNEGLAEKLADARGMLVSRVDRVGQDGRTAAERAAEAETREERIRAAQRRAAPAEWLVSTGPVSPDELRRRAAEEASRAAGMTLGDLVEFKGGKAYLRVRQHGFIGGIAFGVALGVLLAPVLFALILIALTGGVSQLP